MNSSIVLESLKQFGYTTTSFDAAMFEAVYLDSVENFITTSDEAVHLFWEELLNSTILNAFVKSE